MTDGDFADRLRVVEDDLVDAYVRGALVGDLLRRFNSHYLASSRSREKVKVAEMFLAFADKAPSASALEGAASAGSGAASAETVWRKPVRSKLFSTPRLVFQWGMAVAALLFLMVGLYLVFENVRLRRELAERQTERTRLEQRERELQQQLDAQRSASADIKEELDQVREQLAQVGSWVIPVMMRTSKKLGSG